jgi:hypothetical protein
MVDFKEHLRRQLKFLENSCLAFDQNTVEEAVRIAASLRVLFHDTQSSKSLLSHLGKSSLLMLSTRTFFTEDATAPTLPLVQLRAKLELLEGNTKAEYRCHAVPRLADTFRKDLIPFKQWWKKEFVIEHKQPPTKLTRRDLILAAANKDGGAHVDEVLDPVYDYVRLGSGLELEIELNPKFGLPTQKASFENIHFASLRQIAYEVLNTPSLLALK